MHRQEGDNMLTYYDFGWRRLQCPVAIFNKKCTAFESMS